MRPKELRIIVTFETTTAAMAFESEAKKRQIGGRLIPVPREITSGCRKNLWRFFKYGTGADRCFEYRKL